MRSGDFLLQGSPTFRILPRPRLDCFIYRPSKWNPTPIWRIIVLLTSVPICYMQVFQLLILGCCWNCILMSNKCSFPVWQILMFRDDFVIKYLFRCNLGKKVLCNNIKWFVYNIDMNSWVFCVCLLFLVVFCVLFFKKLALTWNNYKTLKFHRIV